jgi:hypothetical protein
VEYSTEAYILWTLLDIHLAFAAACLPAFRVLLRRREKNRKSCYLGETEKVGARFIAPVQLSSGGTHIMRKEVDLR